MRRVENLIICYHLFQVSHVHMAYYSEKCLRYLGFIPPLSYFFTTELEYIDGIINVGPVKIKKFMIVFNKFINSGDFGSISLKKHSFKVDGEPKIDGVHPNLAQRIDRDYGSFLNQKGLVREVKLQMLLV